MAGGAHIRSNSGPREPNCRTNGAREGITTREATRKMKMEQKERKCKTESGNGEGRGSV